VAVVSVRWSDSASLDKLTAHRACLLCVNHSLPIYVLPINDTFRNEDYAHLAATLLSGKYAGKVILIAWHHAKTPQLATALGATPLRPLARTAVRPHLAHRLRQPQSRAHGPATRPDARRFKVALESGLFTLFWKHTSWLSLRVHKSGEAATIRQECLIIVDRALMGLWIRFAFTRMGSNGALGHNALPQRCELAGVLNQNS
jgi:hypothetical protein